MENWNEADRIIRENLKAINPDDYDPPEIIQTVSTVVTLFQNRHALWTFIVIEVLHLLVDFFIFLAVLLR
ncbi:MAG: hypothetical protein PUF49_09770 [Firmicutes bacterium]|nr:hypothetical protein [Bacillota bacterium]